jgi:hypothetical protein
MSRGRFLKYFGYDEEFAGHYAHDDVRFTRHQKAHGTVLGRLPRRWYVNDHPPDADGRSGHSLVRDLSWNASLSARKQFELEWYGGNGGHSRRNLNFTWTILADRRRNRPPPAIDRLFKATWYLRQIWPAG